MERKDLEFAPKLTLNQGDLVLLVGPSGSGKSSFLRHLSSACVISSDWLRKQLSNSAANQAVSAKAFEIARRAVKLRMQAGLTTVVDATNLQSSDRKTYADMAAQYGRRVVAIPFVVPQSVCIRNCTNRGRVSPEIVKMQTTRFKYALRGMQNESFLDLVFPVSAESLQTLEVVAPDSVQPVEGQLNLVKESNTACKTEANPGLPCFTVAAGSIVISSEDTPLTGVAECQIVNVIKLAYWLGLSTESLELLELVQEIIKFRARRNLTTYVKIPSAWPFASVLARDFRDSFPIVQPEPDELKGHYIQITRQEYPDDEPLLLIGDVQGCLTALETLFADLEEENRQRERRGAPRRKACLVGDISDRGTRDAECMLYVVRKVQSGEAMLVAGNHDNAILQGLKDSEARISRESRQTVTEIEELCSQEEINDIIAVLEKAPLYRVWKHLVVAHASLPYVPRPTEKPDKHFRAQVQNGMRTKRRVGGRQEVLPIGASAALDPGVLGVGGHTHTGKEEVCPISNTVNLDGSVECKGRLLGLEYPEMEFVSAAEPFCEEFHAAMMSEQITFSGKELVEFIAHAELIGQVYTKEGETPGGRKLTIVSYSNVTDEGKLFEKLPGLRNFRGLIIDAHTGKIFSRPPRKTHKVGDELPLEDFEKIYPEGVYEKANGTMLRLSKVKNEWLLTTKFSFGNKYAQMGWKLLEDLDLDTVCNAQYTYVFEYITPEDPHIVDYQGQELLVPLVIIDNITGEQLPYTDVLTFAENADLIPAQEYPELCEMSIAELYRWAQIPGNANNLEGFMATYRDKTGLLVTVKVKARDYVVKKGIRDYLKWADLIKTFDPASGTIPTELESRFVRFLDKQDPMRLVYEKRVGWMADVTQYLNNKVKEYLFSFAQPYRDEVLNLVSKGQKVKQASGKVMQKASKLITEESLSAELRELGVNCDTLKGRLRDYLVTGEFHTHPKMVRAALQTIVDRETARIGNCAYWEIPSLDLL